jgi:uncharacterized protein YlaI
MNVTCDVCLSGCDYGDKKTLKSYTRKMNGRKIVMCAECEDDFFRKAHKDQDVRLKIAPEGV